MGSFARKINRRRNFEESKKSVRFKCPKCGSEENIPKDVVDYFDIMDGGDPLVPPRFDCQRCDGLMEPVYYVNHDGIVYKK